MALSENGPKPSLTPKEIRDRIDEIEDRYLKAGGAERIRLTIEHMQLSDRLEVVLAKEGTSDVAVEERASHR